MHMVNINSNIEITHYQKSFIEEVLYRDSEHDMIMEHSFYCLSKQITIFLVNEESMKKNEMKTESEYRYEPNSETRPQTEWMGFYRRDNNGLFEHTPIIAICPERIAKCVKNDEEFMFLLAKVIVHEFAHAKMDARDENVKYRTKDIFWHWMEESMANKITLETFQDFYRYRTYRQKTAFSNQGWGNKLFDFVVDFIKNQPPEYALGYEIFDKGIWWRWSNDKDELSGQKKIKQKTKWLEYMQQNYKNIDETEAKKLYAELLESRSYITENKDDWFKEICKWADSNNIEEETFPRDKDKLLNLTELDLLGGKLTTIPKEIGNLASLTELDLADTKITIIPKEIGNLVNLTNLYLDHNQITTIPKEIGNLVNLINLRFGYNQITTIPKEIGNLASLTYLDLESNKITTIPKEIGNLASLEELELENNQITTIPKEVKALIKENSLQ